MDEMDEMDEIDEEIKRLDKEIQNLKYDNTMASEDEDDAEELPEIEKIKLKPKKKGASMERMKVLHQIRRDQKKKKDELKAKEEEDKKIKREKIEFEYEEAQRLKEAIEKKKIAQLQKNNNNTSVEQTPIQKARAINNSLIKSASRDILKEKYLEEAKRRVMMDLFS